MGACADRKWNGETPTGCEFSANYHTCNAFWGGSVLASLRGSSYRCMLVNKAEAAVGAYCWEFAGKKSECEAQPGCKYFDNLGFCNSGSDHYRNEKAVGGFHTDRSCQGHSECTEHSMGSCDNRNGKCHYGYWYKGESEAEVGCPRGMIPDPRGGCMHAEVATADPSYWWNMAFATPSSSFTAEDFVVYGFSVIGFGAVVYGAAQLFLKKSSGDAVYEEV